MKKWMLALLIMPIITVGLMAGCKDASKSENTSSNEEFVGRFSGPAGFMEFTANGEVQINFSDDHVWDLYPPSYNKSHKYQFITEGKEVVPYGRAEKLVLLNIKDGKYFDTLPCKVEESRIVLYPGGDFEAVFEKEAK